MARTMERSQLQLVWTIGALERLTNLGMIAGFDYHVKDIDMFLAIDENRDKLFDKDEDMARLVAIICRREGGMTDKSEIGQVMHLVKEYRDSREELLRFAFGEFLSRS